LIIYNRVFCFVFQLDVFTAWMITRLYKKEKICRFHQSKPIPFQVCFQHPLLKGAEGNENISNAYN